MQKLALITGGSSGIGFQIAKKLAQKKYSIIITGKNSQKLQKAADNLRSFCNADIDAFCSDTTDEESLKKVFLQIKAKKGKLDMLILNAGSVSTKLISEYTNTKELKREININLWGTILATYIFLSLLDKGAKILLISSAFGLMGAAGYTTYCASKAGVINFADALRRELLKKEISVHVACPSDIDTPMYREEYKNMPEWMKKDARGAAMKPEKAAEIILKKCFKNKFLIILSLDIFSLILLI
ncbi:MAG: SDR family NAD(P)-dependent oxidoreductase, partial [Deltaproteobacteria bacterium]|nr:SDR family NAD(P)-dependent oxidoreductase [Deltaproteobacteria bacterium]